MKERLIVCARWIRAHLMKPIMVLPLIVVLSREMEEYYPISHYPMYATTDSRPVWYIYLADADKQGTDGFPEPVPMEYLVGVRPAKAKKIYQTRLKEHSLSLGRGKDAYYSLPESEWATVGEELLTYFRERGPQMKNAHQKHGLVFPEHLALVFSEITIVPGEAPRETRKIITVENR